MASGQAAGWAVSAWREHANRAGDDPDAGTFRDLPTPPALTTRLTTDGLAMRFGRRRLFEGLSVDIEPGAPLAVVGANGTGKSTLLLVLAGVVSPTGGTVRLVEGGREVPAEERPQRVGLVAPALQLYDALTARENLSFLAAARRLPEASRNVDAALDRVGLLGRAGEPLATFSTGMRQRMRIASAILHRPPVLLLDEPGATLDAEGRALVADVVGETGIVVVLATNDPEEAALCPRRLTLSAAT